VIRRTISVMGIAVAYPVTLSVPFVGANVALLIVARHHTQLQEQGSRSERRIAGIPAFPGYAPRSIGLAFAVAAVLILR
jgi:hypothetical protein